MMSALLENQLLPLELARAISRLTVTPGTSASCSGHCCRHRSYESPHWKSGKLRAKGSGQETSIEESTTMSNLLDQCRKPTGWLGRLLLWMMNVRHSKLTDWGLQQVSVGKGDTILDVGCGGGETVRKLAAIAAESKVYGIDHSEQSVAAARRTNRQGIAEGRVEIRQASVSELPFSDDLFDLVTAVETQYFWPDLPADMREVLRVLKSGGTLIIMAEAYKGGHTTGGFKKSPN